MTRDTAREMAVQLIFGLDHCDADREAFLDTFFSEEHFSSLKTENEELYIEYPSGKMLAYIQRIVFGVFDNLEEIDGLIQRYSSVSWDIARISGTALAVLRVAVFEILYLEDVPVASAINSAVEIDKKYDTADTVAFVNGCLGAFMRAENLT